MRVRQLIATTAAVLSLGIAMPAYAQQVDEDGAGSADGNAVGNDYNDLLSNNDVNVANDGSNAAAQGSEISTGDHVVADQELKAIIINKYLDEVVDLDGEDDSDTNVGYQSGNNAVRGNAFAAYAGILNQAWNTGINANTQAATNMAARGTVNFGSAGDGDNGGGNGD